VESCDEEGRGNHYPDRGSTELGDVEVCNGPVSHGTGETNFPTREDASLRPLGNGASA
jgi:hypothetical protein